MDDQQQTPKQNPPQPTKSVDGVKPAPKLSGENQEHHLKPSEPLALPRQQAVDNVKPVPAALEQASDQLEQPPAEQKKDKPQKPHPKHPDKKPAEDSPKNDNFPYAAVTLAVIVGAVLVGLAIFIRLSA